MSTPISTLPLKTQQTNNSESNDINDPVVQDVLNEFQEELMISKQSKSPQISNHQPYQHQQQQPPMMSYPPPPMMSYPTPPMTSYQPPQNSRNNINKYDNISSYLDIEVAKKSLILVIISLIVYNSGIINTVYEKLPEYLQDNLNTFDIYIKSISLFSIIYVLSFFEYI